MAFGVSWGNTSLSFSFVIYILISISLGLTLIKQMYTLNKPISAMIILILLILIFIFFGKRWFQHGQLKGSSAWTQANALQSGSTSTAAVGQCAGGSPATLLKPSIWPPVVNYCPDFMIVDSSGNCIDKNKLYGPNSSAGTTTISKYTGNTNVCASVTTTASKYLRWEGVVEAEGACNPANIGKPPSN